MLGDDSIEQAPTDVLAFQADTQMQIGPPFEGLELAVVAGQEAVLRPLEMRSGERLGGGPLQVLEERRLERRRVGAGLGGRDDGEGRRRLGRQPNCS